MITTILGLLVFTLMIVTMVVLSSVNSGTAKLFRPCGHCTSRLTISELVSTSTDASHSHISYRKFDTFCIRCFKSSSFCTQTGEK